MPHSERPTPNDLVLIDKPRPHTTVITLNRPERMNSMAFELMVPLHEAFEEVGADNDTTCVVLTGTGRGFCSGADTSNDGGAPPNIDGLTLTRIATRAMSDARRPGPGHAAHAPAGDLRDQRCRDRRRHVPHPRRRHPPGRRVRLLPGRRHQQRPDRHRARPELPAPAGDRLVAGVRDHALGPRRRRPRGRRDRARVTRRPRRRAARPRRSTSPTRSTAGAPRASR